MNLAFIRYFLAVAETASFTTAAERCHVTQPTLSAGIARLEHEMGARLFDRGRRAARFGDRRAFEAVERRDGRDEVTGQVREVKFSGTSYGACFGELTAALRKSVTARPDFYGPIFEGMEIWAELFN